MDLLNGVRVADFTRWIAGPTATLPLAFMGAEVIKIESGKFPDIFRDDKGAILGERTPSIHSAFNAFNLNKISITLDLHRPEGIDIAKNLVKVSDIVVENFRPGIMDRLGLGYACLKNVKDDIIMLSISSHGATGPERNYGGYAATFGPLSGLSYLTGYPDGPPAPVRSRADMMVGFIAAFSAVTALVYRQRTGQGQFIDVSAREALTCAIGETLIDYSMNNRIPSHKGNQDDVMAPHNCYRCKGVDKWVSIAISTNEEWQAFCRVTGHPSWVNDRRFSDAYNRWQNQGELDQLIEEWTNNYTHYEVMEILQQSGVAAIASLSNQELYDDPHCNDRQVFTEVDYPGVGKIGVLGPVGRVSNTAQTIVTRGPLLGEHNQYVLQQVLGLSLKDIAELETEGILY